MTVGEMVDRMARHEPPNRFSGEALRSCSNMCLACNALELPQQSAETIGPVESQWIKGRTYEIHVSSANFRALFTILDDCAGPDSQHFGSVYFEL